MSTKVMHQKLIINDQITLSEIDLSEVDTLYQLTDVNRDYLAQYLPWATKNTRDDSAKFIEKVHQDRANGAEYGFGIYFVGKLVGHISLMHLTDEKAPEIGYWIDLSSSGKGITSKAAECVTDLALNTLGCSEVVIKADIANAASNKIAQNLGYKMYSIEKSDNGTDINVWRKTNEQ